MLDDPERYYDRVIDIDLDELGPHLVGPHTPDLDRPLAELGQAAREEGYPVEISYALVGSCTNSSYEDIGRAAHVARQAKAAGLTVKSPLLITPGSEQVRATIERDGLLDDLEAIGATVLANACGPCIGQWQRDDIAPGRDATRSSRRSTGTSRPATTATPSTLSFIGSPETVTAMALTGRLDVDFVHEPITAPDGSSVQLEAPVADELPSRGFDPGESGFLAPADDPASVEVVVAPGSDRLELLEPFAAWDGNDYTGLRVLLKAVGKCTTDHISPAGQWLRYRGHLTNISGNLFSGVNNAFHLDGAGTGDRRARRIGGVAARSRQGVQGRGHRLGRDRRRELRRGIVARARRDGAAVHERQGGHRPVVRAHRRGEPEEAGCARAHVRQPGRLRADPRRRHGRHPRPCRARAREAR